MTMDEALADIDRLSRVGSDHHSVSREEVTYADTVLARSLCKLAAIGTIADVVPLVGENRAIVSLGLRCLADVRNPGLRALLDAIGIPPGRRPTTREIAFRLAPRIKAAGRVEDASLIMDLLSTGETLSRAWSRAFAPESS